MKLVFRSATIFFLVFAVSVAYGFVGGAHGGFSGGGGHSSGGHSGSSTSSIFSLGLVGLILLAQALYLSLKRYFYKTHLGIRYKRHKQKKYIKKCRYTPLKSKYTYTSEDIAQAIRALKLKAMEEVKELNYLSDSTHHQLENKTLKSFEQLQNAWNARSSTKVQRACSNPKYSNKLVKQINKMTEMDIYNYIAETVITECHFVAFYKPVLSHTPVLRFVIKGEQIDEYTTEKYKDNPGIFTRRAFNCLVDVIPSKSQFKIYQIKINRHTDDYVMGK